METDKPEPVPQQPVDTNQHQPLRLTDLYPAKKRKKYPMVILFVLLLVGLGFAVYKIGSRKPADKPAASNGQSQISPTVTEKDVPDAPDTKAYENGFLGVKLSYPSNWTATESANKDGVRFESPDFRYQTLSQGEVTGNFRVYVRKGARNVDGKYIGRGYAMQPSEKLVYATPAVGQRPDTFLSLFGLDTPDNFAFFLIAGNYNLVKGDTLGPTYGKELETYIITGGFASKELKDDLATNPVALKLITTSNAYKQALGILKSLQLR